jgi:hypothetical protein
VGVIREKYKKVANHPIVLPTLVGVIRLCDCVILYSVTLPIKWRTCES